MHLYGKICSLFLLLAWCNVAFSVSAPNIQVCPDFEEFTYSYECQPTCASPTCQNADGSQPRDKCTCQAGYVREFDKGRCIRATSCP
uniref:TIL domain-containing protein n=1 Tax=Anopheles atroparvus TaxID=41427 RepID=A0AAG5D043_ANOAO